MTTAKTTSSTLPVHATVILFGIDGRGKPKAARFKKDHADLAIKAAGQLQLQVLANNNPQVDEIAIKLPVGRVHAKGKAFVPFVRRDLYDRIVAIASNDKSQSAATPQLSAPAPAPAGKPGGHIPNLPKDWREIGIGDLVLAQEAPEDGWYEAIVLEATGDMFTLRWRHYPQARKFARHRNRLGLLFTGKAEAENNAKQPSAKTDKSLPRNWQEIDVGHLVLAKDDGPWESWWEALTQKKVAESFELKWRDYPALRPITRPRFELALLCPDAF
jgi:hypothetical protein